MLGTATNIIPSIFDGCEQLGRLSCACWPWLPGQGAGAQGSCAGSENFENLQFALLFAAPERLIMVPEALPGTNHGQIHIE